MLYALAKSGIKVSVMLQVGVISVLLVDGNKSFLSSANSAFLLSVFWKMLL